MGRKRPKKDKGPDRWQAVRTLVWVIIEVVKLFVG